MPTAVTFTASGNPNNYLKLLSVTGQTRQRICWRYYFVFLDANQYLSPVHEEPRGVKNLISYFSKVDDPVEIIFFGDHQPSLNSNFYPILNGKGLTGLTEDELEKLYTVPFFIWTNYDTPEETVDITSLDYLSTMALERAGIELPAYNKFLADMQEVVPAINSRGYYSKSKRLLFAYR